MGRREKHKFLKAERSKLRKKKKKSGSKGKAMERKEKTRKTIINAIGAFIVVAALGFVVWVNTIGRWGASQPTHTAFQLVCYIDETTFDVDPRSPFYETWRQVYIENRDVDSYTTATLEISRAIVGGSREYFDVIRNVWGDQIYMMEEGALRPQNRTYNIISIARLYFEQTVPCYVRDQVGIEVKQFEDDEPYTGSLKYHYTIAGTIGSEVRDEGGQYYRIQPRVSTVQETMAQDLQSIPQIPFSDGEAWAGQCTRHIRLG